MKAKRNVIPYGKHFVDDDDVASVVDVLNNRFLTQGQLVPQFESDLAHYTQAKFAVSVNSGTSGLHVACLAADVGPGDWVWTVPNSFVASANCAKYCGADVDFVDIDPQTRNMSAVALEQKLNLARETGKLPKVVIVVHFAGISCDMERFYDLAQQFGFLLVEDAAHGLGGSYKTHKIGSCKYSHMTVLSFHPVKSITTAEGGAVMTNDASLHRRLQLFAKHGTHRDTQRMEDGGHGPWYYEQSELGFNYRLSDIHCALGISQLKKIDQFIARRKELAAHYTELLKDLPLHLPSVPQDCESAWHLYCIELLEHDRKEIYERLHAAGVGVNVHYIPIHMQPYYQNLGFRQGDFPFAEQYYKNTLTIPLFPTMTADDQSKVISSLHEVLS